MSTIALFQKNEIRKTTHLTEWWFVITDVVVALTDTVNRGGGETHQHAQAGAAGAVNRHLILRNWLIGAYLIEFEQNGEDRAKYGTGLLKRIVSDLKAASMGGLGVRMLTDCRTFYRVYPQIRQPAVAELAQGGTPIGQPVVGDLKRIRKSASLARKLTHSPETLPVAMILRLSWTHLLELIRLDGPWRRAFSLSGGPAQTTGSPAPHRRGHRLLDATVPGRE